jgi:uncharacterized protein YdeI (YjbR/CyaY-like superfamily)
MKKMRTVHFSDRTAWRSWLKAHYRTDKEVWLVHYRKETGKPRISYNDSVEEALCFGWIDSTQRTVYKLRYAQRFSPRRPGVPFSETNKERLRSLVRKGKVMRSVRDTLDKNILKLRLKMAPDIRKALKSDKNVWRNFQAFSDGYKRIRIGFIEGARDRPQEFQKRLRYFVKMTAQNKRYGYGGVEKYY